MAHEVMWRTHELERLPPLGSWVVNVPESRRPGLDRTSHITWGGGRALASLLASSAVVEGRRVVELGTGSGVVALTCAALGATSVLATDVDEAALTRVTAADASVMTRVFDVASTDQLPPCDILLAADVAYTTTLAVALARRAREALARGTSVVLASAQGWCWDALVAEFPRDDALIIEKRATIDEPRRTRIRLLAATPRTSSSPSSWEDVREGDLVFVDSTQDDGAFFVVSVLLGRLSVVPVFRAAHDAMHVYYDLDDGDVRPVELDRARVRRRLPVVAAQEIPGSGTRRRFRCVRCS